MTEMERDLKHCEELCSNGRLDEAFELYTKVIDENSGHENLTKMVAEAFNNRGQIKYLRVDFDEAIEDYTSAIQLNKNFAVAYYNRGQIHYRLGRFKLAEVDLQRALELKPDFEDARLNLNQVQSDLLSGHQFNLTTQTV